ncbi:hypothetical protein J2X36_002145 [Methylobacterium sp. BE186]|uniref:hypothetical protein n=1 Tax=Methylobacterium sp. BE186 TaxID=2817715 RepID=UPI0028592C96|nr:hypothetical protein [Methylobacterium sp. BE186]MDR7037398.1 hypothetical protein [Methylobacterium sp. BE186]
MQVKYIPQPGEPDTVTAYGVTLETGKWAEVDDKFALKVAGNPHFESKNEPDEVDGETFPKARRGRAKADADAEQRARLQQQAIDDAKAEEAAVTGAENA